MKKSLIIFLVIISSFSLAFPQTIPDTLKPDLGEYLGKCAVCGAPVYQDMLTRVDLIGKDKSITHVCGLDCATELIDREGKEKFKDIWVIDYYSGKQWSIINVFYVLGSNIRPAGGRFPAIAFDTGYRAEYFMLQHGGQVYKPNFVLDLARDFRKLSGKK